MFLNANTILVDMSRNWISTPILHSGTQKQCSLSGKKKCSNLLHPCTQNGSQNSLSHPSFDLNQGLHACDSGQDTDSANHHGKTVE